jgi:dolichol-phosphate mannosyltransferase
LQDPATADGQIETAQRTQQQPANSSHSKDNAFPILSIVIPTYNEKANLRPLCEAIASSLIDIPYEIIIVDDDSPDGTWKEASLLGSQGFPVRCLRRVGRRGLSSAVIEGVLSARAEFVGIMDADMQHDEKLLPEMLQIMREGETDIVIASRYIEGGGLGEWDMTRQRMSTFATMCSRLAGGEQTTDPMSGFFMTRREIFDAHVHELSLQGYKILLDVLASVKKPLKIREVPLVFRQRNAGESKLDFMILAEYVFLLIDKFSHGLVPPRFVLFSIIGGLGLGVHLGVLKFLQASESAFLPAQAVATLTAMSFNFILNNSITYRSNRLRGYDLLTGYLTFCAACSLGALANLSVAHFAILNINSWAFAGAAGALMSAVFNFSISTNFVWGAKKRKKAIA